MQKKHKKYFCFLSVCGIIYLMLCLSLPAYAAEGGSCGDKLTWKLSGDTLTISGSGDMTDYKNDTLAPWYSYAEEIRAIVLPSGLTSVGDYAFCGCTNLTNIEIPDNVTSVGKYSFAECTNLLSVDLGNGLQAIEKGAFHQCESLQVISFPTSLTSIGSKAFYRCYGLWAVTIPSSVTSMGSAVFAYCEGLLRATINASIDAVPFWTFFGCSSLLDVSLAPQIVSIEEHAFYDCENLGGIYTQSNDIYVASKLEDSIPEEEGKPKQGHATSNEIPESSVLIESDENKTDKIEIIQKGDSTVIVKETTEIFVETPVTEKVIEAVIERPEDWNAVAESVDLELEEGAAGRLDVELQLMETKVEETSLAKFAGKPVILEITTGNGVIWKIDMSKVSEKDIKGTYNFEVELTKPEKSVKKIESDTVYKVKFADRFNFNVTVGFRVGELRQKATFYQKNLMNYKNISTVLVDYDQYAWFSLAGIDKGHIYYIGLEAADVTAEEAVIPETMYQEYGLQENGSYLTDEQGVQYRITGRTSRWGITGKQFAIYVGMVIAAAVLVVGIVMVTLNIIKKSRENYERMLEEEGLIEKEEEEALRLEIMKELLGESDDKLK